MRKTQIPLTIIALLFAGLGSAQEVCNLSGRVKDASTGLPLPGAPVSLLGTQRETLADHSGLFYFNSLPVGHYDLEADYLGYEKYCLRGIMVTSEAAAVVEIRLQPAALQLPLLTVKADPLPSGGPLSGARVITRETIQAQKPRDLAELLEKAGLAELSSEGSPGSQKYVTIRGSTADQVTVLLDGHPLNDASSGLADLSKISLAEVQQVEVYSQAPAGLSAQAVGGVINIITLGAGMQAVNLQAGGSTFGERQASLALGRTWGQWPMLGTFEHRESQGAYDYRIVPDDGLDYYTRNVGATQARTHANFRRDHLTLKLDPLGRVEIAYRQSLLRRQNPDYLPLPELEHESTTDDDRREFSLIARGGSHWYEPKMQIKAEGYHQVTSTDYGSQFPLLNHHQELRGEVYSADCSWNNHQGWREISYGLGTHLERLWSTDLAEGYAERLHDFFFAQVQGNPFEEQNYALRTGLFSGVRVDFYRSENVFVHPNLGLEIGGGHVLTWSLRGEYSGAYHLPSFNALFWQEDLQSRGNPELRPERSINRELAGKLGWQRWELGGTFFDRQTWDLIYWQLDFENKWKPLNLYRAYISGAEVSLRGSTGEDFGDVEVSCFYRWMRSLNQSGQPNSDGNLLPYRPVNTTTLLLKQYLDFFSLDLSARWVGRRYTNEANTKSLSPYCVWDMGLSKEINLSSGEMRLTLRSEVRNAFNEGYRIIEGAPTPLREWWVSMAVEHRNL